MDKILSFSLTVLEATARQFVTLFGLLAVFGLTLYVLARLTRVSFVKSFGPKADIYFTGWIGVPVHELSHALMCILFRHRITNIQLFTPNTSNGTLGQVQHSYNSRNLYHQAGNFFIGIGPVLVGATVLFVLSYYLFPSLQRPIQGISVSHNLFSLAGLENTFSELLDSAKSMIETIFDKDNLTSWQFWVFLYLGLAIASHMELSPADFKGMWAGLLFIIALLLVANIISTLLHYEVSFNNPIIAKYNNFSAGIYLLATIISFVNFVISYLILNIITLLWKRRAFHPFG